MKIIREAFVGILIVGIIPLVVGVAAWYVSLGVLWALAGFNECLALAR